MHHPKLDELIRRDPRYPQEAYQFVYAALAHTQAMLRQKPRMADSIFNCCLTAVYCP